MKKLTLDSSLYKKLFEISDSLSVSLASDIDLLTISLNNEKLSKYIIENSNWDILEAEVFWRLMHYSILDNINLIWKYLDNSDEVKYLKTTFLGVFEILELSNNEALFLNHNTNKTYKIIWEWKWSETSLESDFEVWDIIISRLINLEDWWYNMKNYYFINKKRYGWEWFEKLKFWYSAMLAWVSNVFELEERMNQIMKVENN